MDPTLVLAGLAALVFVGFALEELFRRTGVPDVLVLLVIGLILGQTGVLDVAALRGLDQVFTTAALVLILFEGAVRMKLSELMSSLGGAMGLAVFNFVFTIIGVAGFGILLLGLDPLVAVTFGVILGGISSAVVIPMVNMMEMRSSTRTALSLESAFSDVLCIVFALALLGALSAGSLSVGGITLDLALGLTGGVAIGGAAGYIWAVGLRSLRKRRTSFLAIGAVVFLVYALAESLGTFAAISVLAFGVVLGNASTFAPKIAPEELEVSSGERFFLAEVAFLLKVFFFVYLGARLDLSGYEPFVYGLAVTAILLLARLPTVRLSLRPVNTPRRDACVAAVMAPRGIAASILAGLPRQAGVPGGEIIESTAFGVVLFSIIGASLLTYFVDSPKVEGFYRRFFGVYSNNLPAPPPETALPEATGAAALIGAAEEPGAPAAPEHPPTDDLSGWMLDSES